VIATPQKKTTKTTRKTEVKKGVKGSKKQYAYVDKDKCSTQRQWVGSIATPSHAIHYELSCKLGRAEIDLSVFGTPPELADEDMIVRKGKLDGGGKLHECLVFSQPDKLTRFGDFREELPMQSERADGTYHAYVFSKITGIGITLFAVFAEDGHEMPTLENQGMNLVLQEVSLSSNWKSHDGVRLNVIRLGQVARPEFLVGSSQHEPARHPHGRGISSQDRPASKLSRDKHRSKRRRKDD
jgi:hypothetical protein